MDLFGARRAGPHPAVRQPEQYRAELAALPGVDTVSDRGEPIRYRDLQAGAHFSIAPFRPGCPWSMSVIEWRPAAGAAYPATGTLTTSALSMTQLARIVPRNR
ncbi:hypothetical protein [Streptomyces mirabilis]|uniref:hypothetical protein n=1 Tax=Streptomyces mirabilis TaxID=68239 RepID=UPI0036DD7E54